MDSKKFSDKPLRFENWNYGWNGFYFVTICTRDHKYFLEENLRRQIKFYCQMQAG